MKNLLFLLLTITFASCSQKELQKEELASASTIVIILSHNQYPKQITIDCKKGTAEYKNLNAVLAASADAKNPASDSKTISLDETSLTKIIRLFDAIDTAPQKRTLHSDGMMSAIEAHLNNGKTLNFDQLNDRHIDEVVFMAAVLRAIAENSKDPQIQKETAALVKAL